MELAKKSSIESPLFRNRISKKKMAKKLNWNKSVIEVRYLEAPFRMFDCIWNSGYRMKVSIQSIRGLLYV